MMGELVPIGNLFNFEKGELQSTKCTPGEYDFITAAEDWKTHNEYAHECEALIIAVAASGSLGRTHYVDGKFISSDLCFILTPKNEEKYPLNLAFYHFVFNSLRPTLVAATKSGTSKESINQTNLKKYELPYFDIEQQDLWIDKLKNTLARKDLLGTELTHQQTLLKKLRQQILQEAIEGKLTVDWRKKKPNVEPASKLLKRIQAEKEQLIKDKKIKKQKILPPISEEEKPFALPDGWVWCRLNNVIYENPKNGYSPKTVDFPTTTKTLKLGATTSGKFIDTETKYINEKIPKDSFLWLNKREILIQRGNSIDFVGVSAIYNGAAYKFVYPDLMMKLKPAKSISEIYLHHVLMSPYCRDNAVGAQKSMPKINQGVVSNTLVSLCSQAEQKAIVAKVEKLLALCDQLETQITNNQSHADQLMQSVLKEAFSTKKNYKISTSI
ncbi:MAG: hypothetical protein COA86_00065 [Kangiella sp.]|nr:MAG: hypothetical protein COA86_00065 [Kangiella sp.]